jgi:mannose-6-phosphate isomerase-like protein (cupin superfamily)
MSAPPAPFDLASRYVKLDADDRGREVAVDAEFWPQIDLRPEYAHGRLVMVFEFVADWPTWEVHPAGEELVCVLEGAMTLILRLPEGDRALEVGAGQSVLIPCGTWHTARLAQRCRALFVTPCAGTRNAAAPE